LKGVNGERAAHQDPVNSAGQGLTGKAVHGTGWTARIFGFVPGIAKLRQQNPVDFTSGQGVEIAGKNHRLSRGDAPITKQLGRMEASFGLDGFVREVRIEKGELPPGHMAHPRPIHGIGFVDAPRTRRRDIGRLR